MNRLNHAIREQEREAFAPWLERLRRPDADGLDAWQKAVTDLLQSRLTARETKALYAYYVRRMSMEAVAEALSVDTSTVSRRIGTGRRKLQGTLTFVREASPIQMH